MFTAENYPQSGFRYNYRRFGNSFLSLFGASP